MGKLINIDYAIVETLKAHPEFIPKMNCIYLDNLTAGVRLKNFTSQNKAREAMKEITQEDLLHFILDEAVKCYNAIAYFYYNDPNMKQLSSQAEKMNNLLSQFPYYGIFQKAVDIIANPKMNCAIYYQADPKELVALVDAVINARYQSGDKLRYFIDKAGAGLTTTIKYGTLDLFAKINTDIEKVAIAKDVKVNPRATNQCLLEVMSGAQLKHQHNEYGLNGTLYATQDVGKKRKNQEDAVLILEHPEIPDFKLIAVSDGMGGVELGDKASSYITQELAKWFKSLPAELYNFPSEVQKLLNHEISKISSQIYKDYNEQYNGIVCGATLVASVITKDFTVNSSIGDSRIYAVRDNQLQLLTRDESAVWPPNKSAKDMTPEELDDLKFLIKNNEILRCIGQPIEAKEVQTFLINNRSYDKLLLLSDGVTDLLTQEQISIISRTTPADKLTQALVAAAVSKDAIRSQGSDDFHRGKIAAGKDNATAAMYSRR